MGGDRRRAGRRAGLLGIALGISLAPALAVPLDMHPDPLRPVAEAPDQAGASAAASAPLDVYVAAWCGYCRALENDLRTRRIPFFAHDIEADARARREYDALGGEGLPLTRVGKQVVRGYDLPAILKLLDRAK